jgi:FIST N domain./FIST C domain.
MPKMLTAHTFEIDEIDIAISDILGQLQLESRLLKNAVGILSCDVEFIETGVVSAICERLPFEVAGATTLASAVPGASGQRILALSVLTSDDVTFSTAISKPLSPENSGQEIQNTYNDALSKLPGKPSLILSFAPVMLNISGGGIFDHLNGISEGIPVFGSFSLDHTLTFEESMTILNGEATRDTLAMILMHGEVNPRFFVSGTADGNIQRQPAIITDSDGFMLKKVNGMPFTDYMDTLGLKVDNKNAMTFPLVITDDSAIPLAYAIYSLTPEGYALLGTRVPLNATLSIGRLDYNAVLEKTRETMQRLLAEDNIKGILIHPCFIRNIMLGPDSDDEIKTVMDMVGDRAPYHLTHAGGEMCPMTGSDGCLVNCFHSYTLIACVF